MENKTVGVQPKKTCKKCSPKDKLTNLPTTFIIFSIYFLFSSVYGTIEIIKDIINLF